MLSTFSKRKCLTCPIVWLVFFLQDILSIVFWFTALFVFFSSILHLPCFAFYFFFFYIQKLLQLESDMLVQRDEAADKKEVSKKGRREKNNKKKKDKSSRGKRKGKGKKGSRKKKHEEEGFEEGFLRVSTTLPEFQSQEHFQPTDLPDIRSSLKTIFPTQVFDRTTTEMSTHKPYFTTEAPSVVPSILPVYKVTEEVDKLTSRYPLYLSHHSQF